MMIFLITFTAALLFASVGAAPLDGLLTTVLRSAGQADIIFPTICPPACERLFHAVQGNNSYARKCSCECPPEAPIYLNTAGYCISQMDECQHNIRFESASMIEENVPVFNLPATNGVVNSKTRILWKESDVKSTLTGQVNCSVTGAFHDRLEHRWRSVQRNGLFDIVPMDNSSRIIWLGSESEAIALLGSVVQLKVACDGVDHFCLSFRAAGITGTSPFFPQQQASGDVAVVVVLVFLLFLTILSSIFVLHFVWKYKKRQLISQMQMQFIQHCEAQQMALRACGPVHPSQFMASNEIVGAPKRRLFFSADFLNRDSLERPPPVAQEFLNELRRMVDSAREKIRMKRFVPMLVTIDEEEMDKVHGLNDIDVEERESCSSQDSPRSEPNSVDSGRESKYDSDESVKEEVRHDGEEEEEEGDSEEVVEQNNNNKPNVQEIISGFEGRLIGSTSQKRNPPPIAPKPQLNKTSQIPKLIGQQSPRPMHRSTALSAAETTQIPTMIPRKSIHRPTPKARKSIHPMSDGVLDSSLACNTMLDKSLPRKKKPIPA